MTGVPPGSSADVGATTDVEPDPSSGDGSLRRKVGRVAYASAFALIFGELVTLGQVVALARLLTPTQVGIFTAGSVLTISLYDFVEGGLRAALVQRSGNVEAAAQTVFRATLASGALMCVGVLAAAPLIGWVFDDPAAGAVAAATSGSLLLFALTNVPEAMLQREFSVRRRIIVGPAVSVTFAVVAVTLAAFDWGVWSMVAGSYASTVVWVICVWWISGWRPRSERFDVKLWRELARFGSPLVIGQVGYRLKGIVEAVIVGRSLGAAELGQYRYAQRIAQIPEKAIIEVGSIALFPAFARIAGDTHRTRAGYLRALRWAMIGGAPLTALMIALGQPAVVVVLGEPWFPAGHAVAAMAGLGIGRAITAVAEEAIKGAGRTKLLNWCTAGEVGVGILLALVLVRPLGLVGVGLAVSITALVVAATSAVLARPVVDAPYRAFFVAIMPPIVAAALAGAATSYLDRGVLHAASHPDVTAVGFLVLELVAFTTIYVAALFAVMPASMRQLTATVLRRARQTLVRT